MMVGIAGNEEKANDIELGSKVVRHDAIEIEWRNITYKTAPMKDVESKTLIYPMSGVAKPGEMLAIMGTR